MPSGIVDVRGTTHELDTVVYATGFLVNDPPFAERVRGRGGRTLAEVWAGSYGAATRARSGRPAAARAGTSTRTSATRDYLIER